MQYSSGSGQPPYFHCFLLSFPSNFQRVYFHFLFFKLQLLTTTTTCILYHHSTPNHSFITIINNSPKSIDQYMGSCLSSDSAADLRRPSANVVAITGELRRFTLPVTASEALESLDLSPISFFLCNSDRLYFDDFIPSLAPNDQLDASQIYFALPTAKLQYRLAASDMAALAVKASVALDQIDRRRKKKARISPSWVAVEEQDPQSNHTVNYRKRFVSDGDGDDKAKSKAGGVSRSGSLRKLSRYSSRRAMQAVRSFKIKLSTIHET